MVSASFSRPHLPSYTINPRNQTEPVLGSLLTLCVRQKVTKRTLLLFRVVHSTPRNSEQLVIQTNKIRMSSVRVRTRKG